MDGHLREEAERRALSVVKWIGDNESGLCVALTSLQEFMLALYIKGEILSRNVYLYNVTDEAERVKIMTSRVRSVVYDAEKYLKIVFTSSQQEALVSRISELLQS